MYRSKCTVMLLLKRNVKPEMLTPLYGNENHVQKLNLTSISAILLEIYGVLKIYFYLLYWNSKDIVWKYFFSYPNFVTIDFNVYWFMFIKNLAVQIETKQINVGNVDCYIY